MIMKKSRKGNTKKTGKKAMHDSPDDEQKEHLKIEDNKRKNEKCDNLSWWKRTVEEIREERKEIYAWKSQ